MRLRGFRYPLARALAAWIKPLMGKRPSKDHIGEETHISERTEAADQREEVGHWEGRWCMEANERKFPLPG
jgi:IS30 family transposase